MYTTKDALIHYVTQRFGGNFVTRLLHDRDGKLSYNYLLYRPTLIFCIIWTRWIVTFAFYLVFLIVSQSRSTYINRIFNNNISFVSQFPSIGLYIPQRYDALLYSVISTLITLYLISL